MTTKEGIGKGSVKKKKKNNKARMATHTENWVEKQKTWRIIV
jgi:hypothetical protein